MDKPKRTNGRSRTLLHGLRQLTASLPTRAEKQEIETAITSLLEFLTFLRASFGALPASEEMASTGEAARRLEDVLTKAQANPSLASALGLRKPSRSKRIGADADPAEHARAQSLVKDLESLPVDDIRVKLTNEALSLAQLRGVASELGIHRTKDSNREALAHQILMKIANYRGYRHLRGETDVSHAPGEKANPPGLPTRSHSELSRRVG